MREIKFRAKTVIGNEWAYGHYAFADGYHAIYDYNGPSMVKLTTVGQYTGLKDKNGVEIYEGDIVQIYNDEIDDEDSWIDVVSYHMGGYFSGDEDLLDNVHFRVRVIGNIYEHNHLLE